MLRGLQVEGASRSRRSVAGSVHFLKETHLDVEMMGFAEDTSGTIILGRARRKASSTDIVCKRTQCRAPYTSEQTPTLSPSMMKQPPLMIIFDESFANFLKCEPRLCYP